MVHGRHGVVHGPPGPRGSTEALLAPRSRRTSVGGDHTTHRSGNPCQRAGGGRTPFHTARGGGRYQPRPYWYVRRSRWLGTPAEHLGHSGSASACALERLLPLPDVRPDLGNGAGPRPDLQAHSSRCGGRLWQARRFERHPGHRPCTHIDPCQVRCGLLYRRRQGAFGARQDGVAGAAPSALARTSTSLSVCARASAPRRSRRPGRLRVLRPLRRLPRRALGGPQRQGHERGVVCLAHGLCLIVGSAYHKNTDAKVERADGVIRDTLRAYLNGRKHDWDSHLPLAELAIDNTASTIPPRRSAAT